MRRAIVAIAAIALFAALPARAQFRSIARGIEAQSGMSRVHVPGMWLARLAMRFAAPEGVHDLKVAIFESSSARHSVDAATIMRSSLGPEWQPIVRSTSHRTGEQAVIYDVKHALQEGLADASL